jgi:hypothetical protein
MTLWGLLVGLNLYAIILLVAAFLAMDKYRGA